MKYPPFVVRGAPGNKDRVDAIKITPVDPGEEVLAPTIEETRTKAGHVVRTLNMTIVVNLPKK